jgi:HTH-type transcriptional regulator/antitoxin HigA
MKPKIIKTEPEYAEALARVESLMDAKPGTPKEEELELWSLLIERYEQQHFPIDIPEPVEAAELGLNPLVIIAIIKAIAELIKLFRK